MFPFHCYRWNQLEVIPDLYSAHTWRAPSLKKNTLLRRPCSPTETT